MRKLISFLMTINAFTSAFKIMSYSPVVNLPKSIQFVKSQMVAESKNELDDLLLDISKLDISEKERLESIQRLTEEADQIVRAAGFPVDIGSESLDVTKPVMDTDWSGQSGLDISTQSTMNINDAISRWPLAVGDVITLILFVTIGRANHGEEIDMFNTLMTAGPFVFSWLLFSPLFGAYTKQATSSRGEVFKYLVVPWIVSISSALVIRGLLKGSIPPTPFIFISYAATLTLLGVWRTSYIYLFGETSDSEYRKAGAFEVRWEGA